MQIPEGGKGGADNGGWLAGRRPASSDWWERLFAANMNEPSAPLALAHSTWQPHTPRGRALPSSQDAGGGGGGRQHSGPLLSLHRPSFPGNLQGAP